MTTRRRGLWGSDVTAYLIGSVSSLFVPRQEVGQFLGDAIEVCGLMQQFLKQPRRRGHREGRCFFPRRAVAPV